MPRNDGRHTYAKRRRTDRGGLKTSLLTPSAPRHDAVRQAGFDPKVPGLIVGRKKESKGHFYDVYHGSFGTCEKVLIKTPKPGTSRGRASDEIDMLNHLGSHHHFVRQLYSDKETNVSVVEEYYMSIADYLNFGSVLGDFKIDIVDVAVQLIEALQHMGSRKVIHQDLRLGKMFIHRTHGKLSL